MMKQCKRALSCTLAVFLLFAALAVVPQLQQPAQTAAVSLAEKQGLQPVQPASESLALSAPKQVPAPQNITPAQVAELIADEEDFETPPAPQDVVELAPGLSYIKDELFVFFAPGTLYPRCRSIIEEIGGTIIGRQLFFNRYTVRVENADIETLAAVCERLQAEESVVFASPNISHEIRSAAVTPTDPWKERDGKGALVDNTKGWSESKPDGSNWWLEAVQAPSAWENNGKTSAITIGVLDSGFAVSHEDLKGRISFPDKTYEEQNRGDSHGTHVAGIIAANPNNSLGITGLNWKAKLLCVDWEPLSGKQSWDTDQKMYLGFIAAVMGGAKVVNFSVGATMTMFARNPFLKFFHQLSVKLESFTYAYAMASLLKQGYDFLVVQSAGNGSLDGLSVDSKMNGLFCSIQDDTPFVGLLGVKKAEMFNRIIVVASAENLGSNKYRQSVFSNAGDKVDIAAPGTNVFSCVDPDSYGEKYDYLDGTSMAAPIVSAIAGMVWSINPKLTGPQVKAIVCDKKNTRYDVADNTDVNHPLKNTYRMVNADLAVKAAIATLK